MQTHEQTSRPPRSSTNSRLSTAKPVNGDAPRRPQRDRCMCIPWMKALPLAAVAVHLPPCARQMLSSRTNHPPVSCAMSLSCAACSTRAYWTARREMAARVLASVTDAQAKPYRPPKLPCVLQEQGFVDVGVAHDHEVRGSLGSKRNRKSPTEDAISLSLWSLDPFLCLFYGVILHIKSTLQYE